MSLSNVGCLPRPFLNSALSASAPLCGDCCCRKPPRSSPHPRPPMQYTVDSEIFNLGWYFQVTNLSLTAVSLALYGIYVNLFLLSLYTLSLRKTAATKILMVASCMMAVVGSTQMALDVSLTVAAARLLQQIVHSEVVNELGLKTLLLLEWTVPALQTAKNVTFTINNFITDFIFLYRCYVIWGHNKKAIILPALLMLSTFAVGILPPGTAVSDVRIPFSLGAATTIVLTALTGGRILWIRHAASHVALDRKFRSRCKRAIVLILESGAVYCTAAIFLVISAPLNREIYSVGYGIGQQVLNIIPTFTLVYVGLDNTAADSYFISPEKKSLSLHPRAPSIEMLFKSSEV
ncbi:hypothetical protein K438DRAFT_2019442 [Mycena galopus ATCC 62051]|nr:hypothetical protein K438DRAFT_2019442 [Mycena galopus ATCC 62051]